MAYNGQYLHGWSSSQAGLAFSKVLFRDDESDVVRIHPMFRVWNSQEVMLTWLVLAAWIQDGHRGQAASFAAVMAGEV